MLLPVTSLFAADSEIPAYHDELSEIALQEDANREINEAECAALSADTNATRDAEAELQALAKRTQEAIDNGEIKYDPENLPQFGYFKEESEIAEPAPIARISARASYPTKTVISHGDYWQETNYTCGPAAARNLVGGYNWRTGYQSTPSEWTFTQALGTSSAYGTIFPGNWVSVLNQYAPGNNYLPEYGSNYNSGDWRWIVRERVRYTTTKYRSTFNGHKYEGRTWVNPFGVIANINVGSANSYSDPIHPYWRGYRPGHGHYVLISGYDDSVDKFYVVESWRPVGNHEYWSTYSSMASSTKPKGIIA